MKKRTKAVLTMLSIIIAFLTLSTSANAKDFSSAREISLGSRVSGILSHTATYDYYSFKTESGNNIYVCSWESDSASNVAEVFSVYNSRGSQMGSSKHVYEGEETQYLKLDPNETYYVEVRANNPLPELNGEYGVLQDYSFVISAIPDEANSIDAAESIELNSEQRGNINNCHVLDKDYFELKTSSGKEYELYGKNVNFDGKIYFNLLDKDGAKVNQISCSEGYSKTEKVELNPNSNYYLYVYGMDNGQYGSNYNIIGDYILALKMSSSDQGTTASPDTIEGKHLQWNEVGGKYYWYENGVKQGTVNDPNGVMGDGTVRGREIFDPASNGWYWLDACYDGAKAIGKEVWIPYIYQNEDTWDAEGKSSVAYESDSGMAEIVLQAMVSKAGKWVRYDENGAMLKGWVRIEGALEVKYPNQAGNIYYYDNRTGLMAKGTVTLNGREYHFDETTGVMDRGSVTINGTTYTK